MPGLRGRTGAVAGWHKRAGRPPALWPRTPAARAPARAPPAADKGSGRTRRRGGHGDAHQNPVGTQETRSMPAARVGQRLGYIAIISGVVAPHPDVQFAHHPHARAAQLAASGSGPGQNAAHRRTKKAAPPHSPHSGAAGAVRRAAGAGCAPWLATAHPPGAAAAAARAAAAAWLPAHRRRGRRRRPSASRPGTPRRLRRAQGALPRTRPAQEVASRAWGRGQHRGRSIERQRLAGSAGFDALSAAGAAAGGEKKCGGETSLQDDSLGAAQQREALVKVLLRHRVQRRIVRC